MTDELATVRANSQKIIEMVEQTAVKYHEEILVRVTGDRVETLMQTNGRTVVSYGTFEASGFDDIDGECEAILPVGGTGSDSKGVLDYLDFAGAGTVEMTFLGDEDETGKAAPIATRWRAEGALNVELRLPASNDDLEAVPWDHPPRWTPDEQYASKKCLTDEGTVPDDEDEWITGPVVIETTADVVEEQIVKPADFADGVQSYPVTVEDGEFVVDVEGAQQDDSIYGEVNAENVEGPDCSREFGEQFADVFKTVVGPVRLQTAPDGDGGVAPPLTVVLDSRGDRTIRHLLGALSG